MTATYLRRLVEEPHSWEGVIVHKEMRREPWFRETRPETIKVI